MLRTIRAGTAASVDPPGRTGTASRARERTSYDCPFGVENRRMRASRQCWGPRPRSRRWMTRLPAARAALNDQVPRANSQSMTNRGNDQAASPFHPRTWTLGLDWSPGFWGQPHRPQRPLSDSAGTVPYWYSTESSNRPWAGAVVNGRQCLPASAARMSL